MIMIPNHRTSMIPLYTVKLDTVSGDDMGQGVLQKTYVVGFLEETYFRDYKYHTNVVYNLCSIQ